MLLRLLGIGWYIGICITAGAVIGLWADHSLGLSPLLTLLGIGLGLIAALAGMIRMILGLFAYITESER